MAFIDFGGWLYSSITVPGFFVYTVVSGAIEGAIVIALVGLIAIACALAERIGAAWDRLRPR